MKKRLLVPLCLGLVVGTVGAQEALRISLAGEAAATMRRQALANQEANVKWGRASFLLGATFSTEFNDNVNYSDADRQQDFILRPGFSVITMVPWSEDDAVYATLDFGYAKYLENPQLDHLLIRPGSQLGLDMYVKDFHFNLHDDIALTEQPVAQGTISDSGNYGEFSNTAGLGVDWDLNKVIASFGFDHQNSISTVSTYSYLDRRSENFFARATVQYSPGLTLGPEASIGFTEYDQTVLNDNVNYSFGAFADWQASAHIHVRPRAGFTGFSFSATANQPTVPDTRSYYLGLEMTHRLNDTVAYSIDGGRQVRLGINSELIELWYAHPRIDWKLIDQVGLRTTLIFENGSDSGVALLSAPEEYTLLGGGLSLDYQLMEKLLVGTSYDYTVKDSNLQDRNYHQHRIQIRFQYTF